MGLISILLLHSTSIKDGRQFLIFGDNHTVGLSYGAKTIMDDATFLVLITGHAASDTNFITKTLLQGKVPNTNDEPTQGQPLFRFHEKIRLADFCNKWNLDCGTIQSNVNFVFIDAGADGAIDEDVFRGILALSPMVSFRIHVMITPGGPPQSCSALLSRTALFGFMDGTDDSEAVAIIVPREEICGMRDDSQKPESKGSQRASKVNLTKWFRDECRRDTNAVDFAGVFERSGTLSLDSARDIAELIVRRARGMAPLPPIDSVVLFEAVTTWMEERETLTDYFPLAFFLTDRAMERLNKLENLIVSVYEEATRLRLQGDPLFELDAEEESPKIAEKAVEEFRQRVEKFPGLLRKRVPSFEIEFASASIRRILIRQLPILVETQQWKRKRGSANSGWMNYALLHGLV